MHFFLSAYLHSNRSPYLVYSNRLLFLLVGHLPRFFTSIHRLVDLTSRLHEEDDFLNSFRFATELAENLNIELDLDATARFNELPPTLPPPRTSSPPPETWSPSRSISYSPVPFSDLSTQPPDSPPGSPSSPFIPDFSDSVSDPPTSPRRYSGDYTPSSPWPILPSSPISPFSSSSSPSLSIFDGPFGAHFRAQLAQSASTQNDHIFSLSMDPLQRSHTPTPHTPTHTHQ